VTDASAPPSPLKQRTLGGFALRLLVAAMVAMWVYVLYLAFGPGRQPPPDRLDDPVFAVEAQARCESTLDAVAELPRAVQAESASERSEIVREANVLFAAMLDDLDAAAPSGDDGELVALWLADWQTYLDDRGRYAEALLDDPEARLLVTAKDRDQITEYLDAFAADNDMPACATPIDV